MNAHFQLAAELLDAGANPNADVPGYTVLHAITMVRKPGVGDNDPAPEGSGNMTSIELVKKLVAKGADVNARMTRRVNLNNTRANELGATPFFLAALTADAELMKTLAALGANPLLTNVENSTPLMAAAGLATRSPGEDAGTESEVLEAVQTALDLGADVNAVDINGETAMHAAAYKNLPKVVKFLAANGAKIEVWNKEDKFGWTPLAIAVGYRFGNFKPSPDTEAAIREVMIAAGVTPPKTVVAKTQQIY
jgi:ankyrin repeat protein